MIKLAVFDIDGTLITKESRMLPVSAVECLKQLKDNGIMLAIASGRSEFALDGDITSKIKFDYFICNNGAHIVTSDNTEILLTMKPRKASLLILPSMVIPCRFTLRIQATVIAVMREQGRFV